MLSDSEEKSPFQNGLGLDKQYPVLFVSFEKKLSEKKFSFLTILESQVFGQPNSSPSSLNDARRL